MTWIELLGQRNIRSVNPKHFEHVCSLITDAQRDGLLIRPRDVRGFSGDKVVGLLQRLAAYEAGLNGGCYLEIGVFQGLSLISTALAIGQTPAIGIDNFSQFDKLGTNRQLVEKLINANDVRNATIVNRDYEDALNELPDILRSNRVGTYFIDGPHDYRSQLVCLLLIAPYLSPSAAIVVDDCNYRHVRLANRDFLMSNPDFRLIFEAYTSGHPNNMEEKARRLATSGWWNGINVIVRDPAGVLMPAYPPTLRNRTLFVNDHLVHGERYAALAPEGVALLSAICSLSPIRAAKAFAKAMSKFQQTSPDLTGNYPDLNTFSEGLPAGRFNPSCDVFWKD